MKRIITIFSIFFVVIWCSQISHAATYYFNTSVSTGSNLKLKKALENGSTGQYSINPGLTGTFKIGTWETTPLGLTSLPAGTFTFNIWCKRDALLSASTIYARVYAGNLSNLLFTSNTATVPLALSQVSFNFTTISATTVNPSDRVIIELYFNVSQLPLPLLGNVFYAYWGTNTYDSSVALPMTVGNAYLSQPSSVNLGQVTNAHNSPTLSNTLGTITVIDGRETFNGWTLSIAASNFTCCSGNGTLSVNRISVNPNNSTFTVLSGSNTGMTVGTLYNFLSTVDQSTIINASNGFGEGYFTINPILSVVIPPGSRSGTYSGTVTITLV